MSLASRVPSASLADADDDRLPLPFLVRPENVSRYEDGVVSILDRRVYPFERSFVECRDVEEVARAIEQMVTQSWGPGPTAGLGLALAARAVRDRPTAEQERALEEAAQRLVATRPTHDHIALVVGDMLRVARRALAPGENAESEILAAMDRLWAALVADFAAVGRAGATVLQDRDIVLTHCWADAPFIHMLRTALLDGKSIAVVCTETRPYLQGARLTADAVRDLGVPTTLITDGMPAHLMALGRIDRFVAGADRVTMDGSWVNKIGTLPIALAAKRFGVPAYPMLIRPDRDAPDPSAVLIEERDPEEVLSTAGVRTAAPGIGAWYPAFDVTPPDLVTAVITNRGVFAPERLGDYFAQ